MIWETIAYFFLITIPSIIYAIIIVGSVLGLLFVIVMMVRNAIKEKTGIIPTILAIIGVLFFICIGLLFGQ